MLARVRRGDAYATREVPERCRDYPKAGQTTIIWKGDRCATAHCASLDLLFEDNIGLIELGERMSSSDQGDCIVRRVGLRNNDRAAKRFSGGSQEVTEVGIGQHTTKARRLTPAQVGRLAA